jgi:hypothetical protein
VPKVEAKLMHWALQTSVRKAVVRGVRGLQVCSARL